MLTTLTLLVVAVVTATLTFLFTRRNEQEKQFRLLQATAYSDYLRGVADIAHLTIHSDEAAILARLADAKTRVCLYGSPTVVALLAAFEREGGGFTSAAQT